MPLTPFGPVAAVSNVLMAALWLTFTVTGFRMARARRIGEHRKWMIRSFTLTMSIITNRLWAVVWVIVLAPQLDTTYAGNEQLFVHAVAGITTWTGWVIPLLISQWWLEHRRNTVRPGTSNRGEHRSHVSVGTDHPQPPGRGGGRSYAAELERVSGVDSVAFRIHRTALDTARPFYEHFRARAATSARIRRGYPDPRSPVQASGFCGDASDISRRASRSTHGGQLVTWDECTLCCGDIRILRLVGHVLNLMKE